MVSNEVGTLLNIVSYGGLVAFVCSEGKQGLEQLKAQEKAKQEILDQHFLPKVFFQWEKRYYQNSS